MPKHEHDEKSPKLTVPQIIEYCKNDLGLTFNLMDEETAAEFLRTHNYFFRHSRINSRTGKRTLPQKQEAKKTGHFCKDRHGHNRLAKRTRRKRLSSEAKCRFTLGKDEGVSNSKPDIILSFLCTIQECY